MKIEITPCICLGREPDCIADSYDGLPHLKMTQPYDNGKHVSQHWAAFCPTCRRGVMHQHKSPYLALKWWNEMQEHLRQLEKGLFVEVEDED